MYDNEFGNDEEENAYCSANVDEIEEEVDGTTGVVRKGRRMMLVVVKALVAVVNNNTNDEIKKAKDTARNILIFFFRFVKKQPQQQQKEKIARFTRGLMVIRKIKCRLCNGIGIHTRRGKMRERGRERARKRPRVGLWIFLFYEF